MTPEQIDAALALCDAATDGPWWWDGLRVQTLIGVGGDPEVYTYATDVMYVEHDGGCGCRKACEMTMEVTESDAAFIAAARTGYPEVLRAIQRVLALHLPIESMFYGPGCSTCGPPMQTFMNPNPAPTWPCATVRAITGGTDEG